jgi:hypothetical protein
MRFSHSQKLHTDRKGHQCRLLGVRRATPLSWQTLTSLPLWLKGTLIFVLVCFPAESHARK